MEFGEVREDKGKFEATCKSTVEEDNGYWLIGIARGER